jgi:hypothetical protein
MAPAEANDLLVSDEFPEGGSRPAPTTAFQDLPVSQRFMSDCFEKFLKE